MRVTVRNAQEQILRSGGVLICTKRLSTQHFLYALSSRNIWETAFRGRCLQGSSSLATETWQVAWGQGSECILRLHPQR